MDEVISVLAILIGFCITGAMITLPIFVGMWIADEVISPEDSRTFWAKLEHENVYVSAAFLWFLGAYVLINSAILVEFFRQLGLWAMRT